ncbi:MAG: type II secretion system protein [Candidatus Liptonbacteria bacterium]|nr:type II secretion system protein [Candidatus Liptonbacteria bacterium]
MQQKSLQKGFTLIELLIVIAILSILAVAVILTLNPAQMLAQARDSQRISDMATLKSAIALYLVDVTSPSIGTASLCYASFTGLASTTGCGGRMVAATVTTTTAANAGSSTGGGWIPINFATITYGSPLGNEPVDPINNATYFYSYATNAASSYQFEIDANMESTRYASSGTSDVESTDGGSSSSIYEVGTNLGL